MSSKKRVGFVLAELMLPLGIGAALVTLAWPQRTRAPQQVGGVIASNERAAIAALRSIAAAQAELAASGAIDTDGDGVGEYGFLGELAGTAPLRVYDPVTNSPALDPNTRLSPPLLPPAFENIFLDVRGENVVEVQGYLFKMFLPDVETFVGVEGYAEDGAPGVGGSSGARFPSPDTGAELWCCYAWPLEDQVTGRRVFFINQEGRVLQTWNDGLGPAYYSFLFDTPDYDAAYSDKPEPPNGLLGMGARLGIPPRRANDGNRWTPLR